MPKFIETDDFINIKLNAGILLRDDKPFGLYLGDDFYNAVDEITEEASMNSVSREEFEKFRSEHNCIGTVDEKSHNDNANFNHHMKYIDIERKLIIAKSHLYTLSDGNVLYQYEIEVS